MAQVCHAKPLYKHTRRSLISLKLTLVDCKAHIHFINNRFILYTARGGFQACRKSLFIIISVFCSDRGKNIFYRLHVAHGNPPFLFSWSFYNENSPGLFFRDLSMRLKNEQFSWRFSLSFFQDDIDGNKTFAFMTYFSSLYDTCGKIY